MPPAPLPGDKRHTHLSLARPHIAIIIPPLQSLGLLHLGAQILDLPCRWHQVTLV